MVSSRSERACTPIFYKQRFDVGERDALSTVCSKSIIDNDLVEGNSSADFTPNEHATTFVVQTAYATERSMMGIRFFRPCVG